MEKHFNKIFWLTSFVVFVIVCLRAYCIPFSHDEAATFFFYIQSDNYLPYTAHVYTNNHVLNSCLANICYHIAGSHRFVLRIPNVLAFIVLCFGVYRHFKYFKSLSSKLILVVFFILTFNFLDFFELCRGYGLSFSFMLLGLSYLTDYFNEKKFSSLVYFSLCWQLALCANLILIGVLLILLIYVYIFQHRQKVLLSGKNIWLQLVNLFLLWFWIKFSFFYKEKGVLDYGVGNDYWLVTFKSLIFVVFGSDSVWLQALVIILTLGVFAFFIYHTWKNAFFFNDLFTFKLVYLHVLALLVVAYYLQKRVLDVNFPEDRTGLFFYLFFVLSFAIVLDNIPAVYGKITSSVFLASSLVIFSCSVNFTDFTSWFYHTMPKHVYDTLTKEFEKEKKLFTVGGHRVREMNYAFLNYRGNSVLNGMDNSEEMQMNCDYYFALKIEKPYYRNFYDEIDTDDKWDRVLLKRKEEIEHKPIYENNNKMTVSGNREFYDFKRLPDTSFKSHNPIEVEVELNFEKVPKPFRAFFVMSLANAKGKNVYYKRIPLNWMADDLNGTVKYIKLTTGNLPDTVTGFGVHIWNIEKEEIKVTLNTIKIYQLFGKGVDLKIPSNYYPLMEKITKKPIL